MSRVRRKPQHAPIVGYRDPVFMESNTARPLRILSEYLQPLVQLRKEGIGDTIVMFGSARIHSREHAQDRLQSLKKLNIGRFSPQQKLRHRAGLRDARLRLEMSPYLEYFRGLLRRLPSWAVTLGHSTP